MKNFIQMYENKLIEDCGICNSKEFVSMTANFKKALKREFPNAKLTGFKANHYDFSGFIEENGKCIYVSYSMNRGMPLNLKCSSSFGGILVRTAKHIKDYRGGVNHFCSFYDLKESVIRLMDSGECF